MRKSEEGEGEVAISSHEHIRLSADPFGIADDVQLAAFQSLRVLRNLVQAKQNSEVIPTSCRETALQRRVYPSSCG